MELYPLKGIRKGTGIRLTFPRLTDSYSTSSVHLTGHFFHKKFNLNLFCYRSEQLKKKKKNTTIAGTVKRGSRRLTNKYRSIIDFKTSG